MKNKLNKWVLMSSVILLVATLLLSTHTSVVLSQPLSGCYDSTPSNVRDGYCDTWGNWIPGYITNDTWLTPAPNYVSGKMVFYGPSVMDATAEYRGIDYEEYGCIGGVSLMSPIDIGKRVWIKIDGEWFGPFCSVDCAKKGEMYSIVWTRGEVIEIGFDFAEEIGMVSRIPSKNKIYTAYEWYRDVEVYIASSRTETTMPFLGDAKPIHYPTWFFKTLEFTTKFEPKVIRLDNWRWKLWGHDTYWYDSDYWDSQLYNIPYTYAWEIVTIFPA